MRKFMVMTAAALMTATSLFAQSDDPKNEISVSYGAGLSLIGDGINNGIGNGIFDSMNGRQWDNASELGTFGLEYFRHLNNQRLAVGAVVTYSRCSEDVIYNGQKEGERTRRYMSVMPAVKYYWVNKEHFGLYSKAAVGMMYTSAKSENTVLGTEETDSDFGLMVQGSLIGLEGGSKHIRGFLELGAGEQGIFLVGARYRF